MQIICYDALLSSFKLYLHRGIQLGRQQFLLLTAVPAERFSLGELGRTSGNSVTFSIVKSGKSDDSSSFWSGIHTVPPNSASIPP